MNTIRARFCNTKQQARINKVALAAENLYETIKNNCPKSRQREIALQKLEEVAMWANKAIAFEEVNK